jgi:hypothetical protein
MKLSKASDALFPEIGDTVAKIVVPLPSSNFNGGTAYDDNLVVNDNDDDSMDDFGYASSQIYHPHHGQAKLFQQTAEGLVIGNPKLKPTYLRPVAVVPSSSSSSSSHRASTSATSFTQPTILGRLDQSMFAPRNTEAMPLHRNTSWAVSESDLQYAAVYDYEDDSSIRDHRNLDSPSQPVPVDRKIAFASKTHDTIPLKGFGLNSNGLSSRLLDGDDENDNDADNSFMRHIIEDMGSDDDNETVHSTSEVGISNQVVTKLAKNAQVKQGGWKLFHGRTTRPPADDIEMASVMNANEESFDGAFKDMQHIDISGVYGEKYDESNEGDFEEQYNTVQEDNTSHLSQMSSSYLEFRKNLNDAIVISEANATRSMHMPHSGLRRPRIIDSNGHNLTTHLEERSRLQGEDTFIIVDTIDEAEADEAPEQGRWLNGQTELKETQVPICKTKML